MQIDIKTSSVKPLRNTYAYIEKRFGDKPASRYQEATYDIQEEINFHYKPLWQPEFDLYDKGRTVIQMKDWYVLKDPRQFYYGAYTQTRAKQQEVLESNFTLVEKHNLLRNISEEILNKATKLLLPLRHYEWGANMNNCYITGYAYGATLTNATMFATMDRLGTAQYLTRVGLLLDNNQTTLIELAKQEWLVSDYWQPLRKNLEEMFIIEDWAELFVAQNLVFDGYIYPFVRYFIENELLANGATAFDMITVFMSDWFDETTPWINSVLKNIANESEENQQQLKTWIQKWQGLAHDSVKSLIEGLNLESLEIETFDELFKQRLVKIGLNQGAI